MNSTIGKDQDFVTKNGSQDGTSISKLGLMRTSNDTLPKLPTKAEFLEAIMETKNADELKNEYDSRFALRRARREEQKVKLMVGKTAFKLPDTNAYKKTA